MYALSSVIDRVMKRYGYALLPAARNLQGHSIINYDCEYKHNRYNYMYNHRLICMCTCMHTYIYIYI